jgi:hypothetical protein
MLIEFDLLFAISALAVIMPLSMFNIISNQNSFTASMAASSNSIASNAAAQALVSQLGGQAGCINPQTLANSLFQEGYQITPYSQSSEYSARYEISRLVVLCGKIYYLQALQ